MPTPKEIAMEQERLYESASLRDDLNDDEAKVLLQWGEQQIERLAQEYPDDFEQSSRFMRQVLKNINRFVGQREFNDHDGQMKYMKKVAMYFPKLGWEHLTEDELFATLPDDKADMAGNLQAILNILSPPPADTTPAPETEDTVQADVEPVDAILNAAKSVLDAANHAFSSSATDAESPKDEYSIGSLDKPQGDTVPDDEEK